MKLLLVILILLNLTTKCLCGIDLAQKLNCFVTTIEELSLNNVEPLDIIKLSHTTCLLFPEIAQDPELLSVDASIQHVKIGLNRALPLLTKIYNKKCKPHELMEELTNFTEKLICQMDSLDIQTQHFIKIVGQYTLLFFRRFFSAHKHEEIYTFLLLKLKKLTQRGTITIKEMVDKLRLIEDQLSREETKREWLAKIETNFLSVANAICSVVSAFLNRFKVDATIQNQGSRKWLINIYWIGSNHPKRQLLFDD